MRRLALLPLALLAAAAFAVGAQASHKPGHGKDGADSLSIRAKPSVIVYGGGVTIDGRLTSAARAGKNVVLQGDPAPFDSFSNLANVNTGASGSYSFMQRPALNTLYRVRQGSLESPVARVLVRIRIGLRVSDNTPRRGKRVRFSGRACPAHVGNLVRIQRRTASGRWATVARTRLREAAICSRYVRRIRVRSDGRYRAVAARHADHARGVSPTRFLNAY